jgi:hypothetical protein
LPRISSCCLRRSGPAEREPEASRAEENPKEGRPEGELCGKWRHYVGSGYFCDGS